MRTLLSSLILLTTVACDASADADTDASDMDTGASDMDTDGGGEMDAPLIEVGAPVNIRGASESACHVPGNLPDSFVFASCVGDGVVEADDADAHCLSGPEPFGALVMSTGNAGDRLAFCPLEPSASILGGAHLFVFAEDYPYVVAVASRADGGSVSVDALALSVSSGGYDLRCEPDGDFGFQEIDFTGPLPVGEVACGALTVVEAVPGQAPIVRVDVGESPTYVQMTALD